MKGILFLSGKGGTGKTSLAGAFAFLMENKVLADCDVDAANLHLLLDPKIEQEGKLSRSPRGLPASGTPPLPASVRLRAPSSTPGRRRRGSSSLW